MVDLQVLLTQMVLSGHWLSLSHSGFFCFCDLLFLVGLGGIFFILNDLAGRRVANAGGSTSGGLVVVAWANNGSGGSPLDAAGLAAGLAPPLVAALGAPAVAPAISGRNGDSADSGISAAR